MFLIACRLGSPLKGILLHLISLKCLAVSLLLTLLYTVVLVACHFNMAFRNGGTCMWKAVRVCILSLKREERNLTNYQSNIYKLSAYELSTEVANDTVTLNNEDEDEIEKKRNKSRMPNYLRERMDHAYKPPPILYKHQKEKKYLRKMYAKLGAKSGIDAAIMWPTKEELKEIIEEEKEWCPTFQKMMFNIAEKKKIEEEAIKAREKDVEERMAKMKDWIAEFHEKQSKKEELIEKQKQKKEKILDEARQVLGYNVDLKDPRFKQMMEEKEEEEKKRLKAERKKLKETKTIAKLTGAS